MKLFQARKEKKQQVATARSIYAEFANAAASSDPAHARALAATFRKTRSEVPFPRRNGRNSAPRPSALTPRTCLPTTM